MFQCTKKNFPKGLWSKSYSQVSYQVIEAQNPEDISWAALRTSTLTGMMWLKERRSGLQDLYFHTCSLAKRASNSEIHLTFQLLFPPIKIIPILLISNFLTWQHFWLLTSLFFAQNLCSIHYVKFYIYFSSVSSVFSFPF